MIALFSKKMGQFYVPLFYKMPLFYIAVFILIVFCGYILFKKFNFKFI